MQAEGSAEEQLGSLSDLFTLLRPKLEAEPFRFFNVWLNHPDFTSFVEEKLARYPCQGWVVFFKGKVEATEGGH